MKPAKTDDVMKSTSSDPSSDKRSDEEDEEDEDVEEKVRTAAGLSNISSSWCSMV